MKKFSFTLLCLLMISLAGFSQNAVIGFNFAKGFSLQANFSQGLTNRYWGQDGYKVRAKSMGLSAAWLFGKIQ